MMIILAKKDRNPVRTINLISGSFLLGFLGLMAFGFGPMKTTAIAAEFVAGSEDIPVMPGLHLIEDAGMVFDSPIGRIVETVYQTNQDRDSVRRFYQETLPALGWVSTSEDTFAREGEMLEVDFFGQGPNQILRFTLAPE